MTINEANGSLWLTALVGLLTLVGTWAVLRATVADLKRDVASMKDFMTMIQLVKAQQDTQGNELERTRSWQHETRNRMQLLGERIAKLEALNDSEPPSGRKAAFAAELG